ncbi:arsenite methyltransferase [Candidatus Contubernalis alkaliaceticus]|uniref:arsenite methyltransferase n=1 Tax=Candidatus Contubernalis alkaliaceticus TaxID=338645 RepID=UPI001F4BFA38|nr:arsenite methyltransferase [Candidatus Contubernalis alkalaceticus]UNC91413.1 arsenite methyltransferase [Candidatus Contubernalis alkalaceticus]
MDSKDKDMRKEVEKMYSKIAKEEAESCFPTSSCCEKDFSSAEYAEKLGYSAEDILSLPQGANMGLGCGNPQAIASLKPGEVVLDLGSGGGLDCFLASGKVGEEGRIIGVDMTSEMLEKARKNAKQGNYQNVEFRLGEIENLPAADNMVDVIISNCVVNLSTNKPRVFEEMFRVLKPGGRVAMTDMVATSPIPDIFLDDPNLYSSCITGASLIKDLEQMLRGVGFQEIKITPKEESRDFIKDWTQSLKAEDYVVSATIEARKPL